MRSPPYGRPPPHEHPRPHHFDLEALRLEIVTTCVGFDDFLDATLQLNFPHADTFIVVTSHQDRKTQAVAQKHGAICVETDLFRKNGRNFNKGAAINAGMDYFQYYGWRLHIDADIVLPDNFRRILFNLAHLDPNAIYGADRADVVGYGALLALRGTPQHLWRCLIEAPGLAVGARYVDPLRGYVPLGFFQLWNAFTQKCYPYSLGSAAHDDIMFAAQWPQSHRRHLASTICYHLCSRPPRWSENWDGNRKQPALKK